MTAGRFDETLSKKSRTPQTTSGPGRAARPGSRRAAARRRSDGARATRPGARSSGPNSPPRARLPTPATSRPTLCWVSWRTQPGDPRTRLHACPVPSRPAPLHRSPHPWVARLRRPACSPFRVRPPPARAPPGRSRTSWSCGMTMASEALPLPHATGDNHAHANAHAGHQRDVSNHQHPAGRRHRLLPAPGCGLLVRPAGVRWRWARSAAERRSSRRCRRGRGAGP